MNWPYLAATFALGIAPFIAWIIGGEIVWRIRFKRQRAETLRELDELAASIREKLPA